LGLKTERTSFERLRTRQLVDGYDADAMRVRSFIGAAIPARATLSAVISPECALWFPGLKPEHVKIVYTSPGNANGGLGIRRSPARADDDDSGIVAREQFHPRRLDAFCAICNGAVEASLASELAQIASALSTSGTAPEVRTKRRNHVTQDWTAIFGPLSRRKWVAMGREQVPLEDI
jgi:hypothetical protein